MDNPIDPVTGMPQLEANQGWRIQLGTHPGTVRIILGQVSPATALMRKEGVAATSETIRNTADAMLTQYKIQQAGIARATEFVGDYPPKVLP